MTVYTDVPFLGVTTSVLITWTAASEGGGFAGTMQYEGDYSTDGLIWNALFSLQTGLSYNWVGAAAGSYYVRVRAYDGQDYGPYAQYGPFSVGLVYTCAADPAVPTYTDVPDGA